MQSLFDEYKDQGKIAEALLVARNQFSKNLSDKKAFSMYFDYLCVLAESSELLEERREYISQASIALTFFIENATLDDEVVSGIKKNQQRISDILTETAEIERSAVDTEINKIHEYNQKALKKLRNLKLDLNGATTQEQFENVLNEIRKADNAVNKNAITDKQNNEYERLTKEHTELISKKMRDLEHKDNLNYNRRAVEKYKEVFDSFKNAEDYKKNKDHLRSIASTFSKFDADRLFSETLIYYNYIYSYIFNEIDDDEKHILTMYSINRDNKKVTKNADKHKKQS